MPLQRPGGDKVPMSAFGASSRRSAPSGGSSQRSIPNGVGTPQGSSPGLMQPQQHAGGRLYASAAGSGDGALLCSVAHSQLPVDTPPGSGMLPSEAGSTGTQRQPHQRLLSFTAQHQGSAARVEAPVQLHRNDTWGASLANLEAEAAERRSAALARESEAAERERERNKREVQLRLWEDELEERERATELALRECERELGQREQQWQQEAEQQAQAIAHHQEVVLQREAAAVRVQQAALHFCLDQQRRAAELSLLRRTLWTWRRYSGCSNGKQSPSFSFPTPVAGHEMSPSRASSTPRSGAELQQPESMPAHPRGGGSHADAAYTGPSHQEPPPVPCSPPTRRDCVSSSGGLMSDMGTPQPSPVPPPAPQGNEQIAHPGPRRPRSSRQRPSSLTPASAGQTTGTGSAPRRRRSPAGRRKGPTRDLGGEICVPGYPRPGSPRRRAPASPRSPRSPTAATAVRYWTSGLGNGSAAAAARRRQEQLERRPRSTTPTRPSRRSRSGSRTPRAAGGRANGNNAPTPRAAAAARAEELCMCPCPPWAIPGLRSKQPADGDFPATPRAMRRPAPPAPRRRRVPSPSRAPPPAPHSSGERSPRAAGGRGQPLVVFALGSTPAEGVRAALYRGGGAPPLRAALHGGSGIADMVASACEEWGLSPTEARVCIVSNAMKGGPRWRSLCTVAAGAVLDMLGARAFCMLSAAELWTRHAGAPAVLAVHCGGAACAAEVYLWGHAVQHTYRELPTAECGADPAQCAAETAAAALSACCAHAAAEAAPRCVLVGGDSVAVGIAGGPDQLAQQVGRALRALGVPAACRPPAAPLHALDDLLQHAGGAAGRSCAQSPWLSLQLYRRMHRGLENPWLRFFLA
eukprot:TRINITY_DN19173_c1_g1_i1.p1 TRINITY_DN19173_c1_g1~~TRINITY_DN19173_c1_g1_i1.p1  ORF type:complete len:891 (+),score=189.70 TRINITY_DN19173_c1_g1_i1:84-2675(+)